MAGKYIVIKVVIVKTIISKLTGWSECLNDNVPVGPPSRITCVTVKRPDCQLFAIVGNEEQYEMGGGARKED